MTLDITPQKFLDTIFQDRTDDEHICVSKMIPADDVKDQPGFWNVSPEHNAFGKWRPSRHAHAWYFCVSTVDGEKNDKGTALRRRTANVVRAHCLVLDDIGTKASPPPVEPNWKLESSEGNFQWGYMIEPTDDFKRYEALVEWCHDQGWGDGGAGGCYRIMRLPGSANLKPGRDEFRSRITHWDNDTYWSLDDLAEDLGCSPDVLDEYAQRAKGKSQMTKTGGVEAKAGIDPLLDWLSEEGHVVQDNGEWVDIICPWHESHTSGANTAGYSPLGRGADDWVQRRAFKCLHEHCKSRNFPAFLKWVDEKGGPWVSGYDPLPWLQERYAYVGMTEQVADLHQRTRGGEDWIWDLSAWSKRNPGKVYDPYQDKQVSVAAMFVASSDTKHVDATAYIPVSRQADTGLVMMNDQPMLNTYVPPNWDETDREPTVFLEHMAYLIPAKAEREHFLDWLAYKIQHPTSRSYSVVMVADGVYGTGRSWIKDAIANALQGKVNTASLAQLIGKGTTSEQNYNDWMAGCQFLVVEEAKETIDRDVFYHGYEVFKQNVDTRVGQERINPKFGRTRTENIYFNALIFTNHRDALAIPENDRRVYVVQNASKMNTPEYYDRLADALDNRSSQALYWWLMRRDVSTFDNVYPPMTPGKVTMIESNASPAELILEHIREVAVSDIVTKKELRALVITGAQALDFDNVMMKPEGVLKHVWGDIGTLKDTKNGYRIRLDGVATQVRALRNRDKWRDDVENGGGAELKTEHEKGKNVAMFPQASQ